MALLAQIGSNERVQALEWTYCAQDIAHWVNTWAWTYDPREQPSTLPFDLFPRQAEFLRWLSEREARAEGGLVEKSRDMGLTWLCCAYALHGWLFRPGFACGFGSRKLELVDKLGDPDSIFEKMRTLLRQLPPWMLPSGYQEADHATFCKFVNPANGATITGEGGDNIGRGGRKSIYFVDEAAFLPRPRLVEASLSQTTRCRIDVSTPNGDGNPFAKKRHGGQVPVFTFHWRDDPRKGDAWYSEQKRALDPVTLAQEVDIDYTASVEGIYIPAAWVRAAVNLALVNEDGTPYQPSGPVVAGYDVAEQGANRNVFIARQGPVVRMPVSWSHSNTTASAWRARDEAVKAGVSTLNYDCIGVGAGVRGTFETAEGKLPFQAVAVNSGPPASNNVWPDGRRAHERFANLRAEMWETLRVRFERAYEFRECDIKHKPEEMISIPDHSQLIAELSRPLRQPTDTGKIRVESKDAMARRGVASPDFADALAFAFLQPVRKVLEFY